MDKIFISFGLVGSVISVLGNLPMLINLIRVKDSTGQSLTAWSTWQIANILLLTYAIYIKDFVFTSLQIAWVIFVTLTMILIIKYRNKKGTLSETAD